MDRFPAWMEVNLDAMKWNIDRVRELLSGKTAILLVVKADAYGHGAVRIARLAAECGIDMLGVATVDEGKELREADIGLPIIVLSPVLPEEIVHALEYDLAVTVSSSEFARTASETAKKQGRTCKVHLEVDTGMGRAGLSRENAAREVKGIMQLDGLEIEGIFTHFPASDSDMDFSREQIESFNELLEELKAHEASFPHVHCANSAAILNFEVSHFNMIRPGLLHCTRTHHDGHHTGRLRSWDEPSSLEQGGGSLSRIPRADHWPRHNGYDDGGPVRLRGSPCRRGGRHLWPPG